MVLLELTTSFKPIHLNQSEEDISLKSIALPFIEMGNIEVIVDANLLNENASDSYGILAEMQRIGDQTSKCLADH